MNSVFQAVDHYAVTAWKTEFITGLAFVDVALLFRQEERAVESARRKRSQQRQYDDEMPLGSVHVPILTESAGPPRN